jgi:two-component system CheB/CheR fusion protein
MEMKRGTRREKSPSAKSAENRKLASSAAKAMGTPPQSGQFPIVGVGASAGGLEAFTQLLRNLPADPGIAFVLVQHLAPAHESMLTELLSKTTAMPVKEVKDGMTVTPDTVYVIPPDTEMVIFQGVLHLTPREKTRGQYMPVDAFLRSLAEDRRNAAIAVILSGTGSDGSTGVRVVKGEGGIVFAQDGTAKYDGMPKSAIDTGCVDFIMPPDRIGAELIRISRHPYLAPLRPMEAPQGLPADGNDLSKVFIMLRSARGVDFSSYKDSTIMRRVTRRMMLQKMEGIEKYVAYLRENPSEIETLYQDLLINVTSFFREPAAFDALRKNVFPHIARKAAADIPVRIWVPGCSTGEEAYSIAISLVEFMDGNKIHQPVQIFATDLDDAAVEKARKGIYPDNISRDVSPERLGRFFEKTAGGYTINKNVREMCIFARHNIVKDPPFSKMDLISCRNVLIYFGPELQKKAIRTFYYALYPDGFLMIGPSESLGEFADLFAAADKKSALYAKRAGRAVSHLEATAVEYGVKKAPARKATAQSSGIVDIQHEADAIVLNKFSPAGFVVDHSMKILQFRGDTGPYLRPAPGEASLNLLKLIAEDLVTDLRTAVHRARKDGVHARRERIRFKQGNRVRYLNIDVAPFEAPSSREACFLVLFGESAAGTLSETGKGRKKSAARGAVKDEELAQLRRDLAASKEQLKSAAGEYEAANEELKALNEELQSSNEEMQSINEELETAKEELQSTNEELTTVNDELQSRNEELSYVNNDLVNVLRGIEIPVIMLGNKLQIRRFNDAAAGMLNLIPTDLGRPISDIRTNAIIPNFEEMVLDVINTLTVKEMDVQDVAGRWYSLRIRPYRTVDSRIDGVLMTMVDITDIKLSLERIREAYDYANDIVETVREPLLILDAGLKVITANRSFYEAFLVRPEETEDRHIYELGKGQWNIPELRQQLQGVLSQQTSFSDFDVSIEFPDIGRRTMVLNAREIRQGISLPAPASSPGKEREYDGKILLAIEDVTERKKIEDAQLFVLQSGWIASGEDFFKSLARYLAENLDMDYVCIDRLEGNELAAQTVAVYFDGNFQDNVRYTLKDTPCGDAAGKTICTFPKGVRELFPQDVILRDMRAESYVGATLWSSRGQPIGLIALIGRKALVNSQFTERMLRTVSVRAAGELERRQDEEALRAISDRYRSYIEVTGELGWTANVEGEVAEDMPSWRKYTGQTYEEIKGWGWSKALHPDDLEHTLQVWKKAVREKSNYEVEYRIRRHDGIYRHFMVRGMSVLNEDGSVREWVGTCIDITARKKSEKALETLNRELQSRASELKAAYKDLESFSYAASHDLRSPLITMAGLCRMILEDYAGKLDDKGKDLLNRVSNKAKQMEGLISDLLAFSRISTKEIQKSEFNMEALAQKLGGELRPALGERDVKFEIGHLPSAYGDLSMINQVLVNLLTNAIKFTQTKDTALIEVGGHAEQDENVYYVRDNGMGFDMQLTDSLFGLFQRIHSGKEIEGTGIGLVIVKNIIEKHGGRVWAEGKPDEGATFYFTLPIPEPGSVK